MGTGYLDVMVDVLPGVLALIPHSFKVVGSRNSDAPGYVRLVLESSEIMYVPGGVHLTGTVVDEGCERVFRIFPAYTQQAHYVEFTGVSG